MTCIVGLVDHGTVWLGADSAGVASDHYVVRQDRKVFRNKQMIFGFTTSFRMGQLIQNSLVIPEHSINVDDFKYLTTTFMDALVSCLESKKFAQVHDNVVEGGTFLLGYRGVLYSIDADFQVGIPTLPYESCGCGWAYAKGAMSILIGQHLTPRVKVTRALEAAAMFNSAVRPPWHGISLSGDTRNG